MEDKEFFNFERNGYTYRVLRLTYEKADKFLKDNLTYKPIQLTEDSVVITEGVDKERNFSIEKKCPMCEVMHNVFVIYKDYLLSIHNRNIKIQELYPYLTKEEREATKTGYCSKCQQQLFFLNYKQGKLIRPFW